MVNEMLGPGSSENLHSYLHARDSGLAHELLGPGDGRALDVGSGEGEDLSLLERRGWSAVGVDARRRGRDARSVLGVAERLPFRSGSFSAATCILVLPHVSSPEVVVREVRRVLRPGGRAVFVVFSCSPLNLRIAVTRYRFSGDPERFSARLYRARGLCRLLRLGGFRDVRYWRSDYLPWMTGLMPAALRSRLLYALDRSDRRLSDGPLRLFARKVVAVGVNG